MQPAYPSMPPTSSGLTICCQYPEGHNPTNPFTVYTLKLISPTCSLHELGRDTRLSLRCLTYASHDKVTKIFVSLRPSSNCFEVRLSYSLFEYESFLKSSSLSTINWTPSRFCSTCSFRTSGFPILKSSQAVNVKNCSRLLSLS